MENSINELIILIIKFCEMIQLKKLLIICILIVSVIFISGCTSDEQVSSDVSTSSQSNQESDTQNPELIIKQSDVPELTLKVYGFHAVPKNTVYTFDTQSSDGRGYTDTLELGYRNVGEHSTWQDQSGRSIVFILKKFDSNMGLIEYMNTLKIYDTMSKEQLKAQGEAFGVKNIDFGNPNIGDNSYYLSSTNIITDIETTSITFIHKNNLVSVGVTDEKDESYNKAIRIAKLVKSRLD